LQYSKLLNEENVDSKLTAYKSNNMNYCIREKNDMQIILKARKLNSFFVEMKCSFKVLLKDW